MSIYSAKEAANLIADDPEGGINAQRIMHQATTFATATPDAPAWVAKSAAAQYMWTNDLAWRCNAASATTAQYKRQLLREAVRVRAFRDR